MIFLILFQLIWKPFNKSLLGNTKRCMPSLDMISLQDLSFQKLFPVFRIALRIRIFTILKHIMLHNVAIGIVYEPKKTYLPSLFIPGKNEEDFRHRYELSLDLLTSLELQCSSQQSVMRLRESQSYRTFQNSFSLDNYFKLASHKLITQLGLDHMDLWNVSPDIRKFCYEYLKNVILWS